MKTDIQIELNKIYIPSEKIIFPLMVEINTSSISGRVDIVAQAADTTDLQSSIDMNNGICFLGMTILCSKNY